MQKVLECSSKGDKRFSAFYARIKLFGEYDSIENHYQLSKRINSFAPKTWRDIKGKKPTHIHINGKDYNLKYTVAFYELMWVKYLDENPNLVEYGKQFENFHDMFQSKNAKVCQADVIRDYVKKGREYILDNHKDFIKLMKENKK
ncbi:uncharacterized protein CBO05P1_006 [Clostridium botulinum B str. Osaka05]|uniref:Uncharacterized protein n=1 Tax=Clostridium botulinum B str. Osaka05 TaxID=1407017 RepID=A0A060N5B7_CLOBO|nr:hypothetical protein [Clostridium botulinum]BAO04725.1 uncharacterized protein CBO05P1_006 [Clostridium botulinum B str. Osaka05]